MARLDSAMPVANATRGFRRHRRQTLPVGPIGRANTGWPFRYLPSSWASSRRAHLPVPALGLLGCHEIGRAEHLARDRQVHFGFLISDFRFIRQPLGQAEVRDTGMIVLVDQDVGRLEIPMQNAALVRILDRLGDGLGITRGAPGMERTVAQQLRQVPPGHVVHREERQAFVVTDFVDGHDVGMLETGRRLGLGAEALNRRRRGHREGHNHLERDDPVQAPLPGLIHDIHTAAAHLLEQFVIAESWTPQPPITAIKSRTSCCNSSGFATVCITSSRTSWR
jgi:hypothetical protein